jgi:hypothetical protein
VDEQDPEHEEPGLLRIPLFVSLAARVFDINRPLSSKAELLDRYIKQQLARDLRDIDRQKVLQKRDWAFENLDQEPERECVEDFLIWLAKQLNEQSKVDFLIEKIQPSILQGYAGKNLYGLVIGFIFMLTIYLGLSVLTGWILPLFFMFLCALCVDFITVDFGAIIVIEEFKFPGFKLLARNAISAANEHLNMGISCLSILSYFFISFVCGLRYGLVLFIAAAALFVIISSLKVDPKIRSRPNQGIYNSLRKFIVVSLMAFPIACTFGSLIRKKLSVTNVDGMYMTVQYLPIKLTVVELVTFGSCISIFLGILFGGGLAVVQHLVLRIILRTYYGLPWNLAQFLTYCHERRLLQQIGGRYRFIHRELLDHFAGKEI